MNWWVVLGVGAGQPAAEMLVTSLAANSLRIWPLGKKTDNFSPLCVPFLVFILFIFKPTIFPSRCPSDCTGSPSMGQPWLRWGLGEPARGTALGSAWA